MKKFEHEDEAVAAAEKIYGPGDWAVVEGEDALFTVTPPTLTSCPKHLMLKAGAKGKLENWFGMRSYVVVERDGEQFFQTVRENE
jgi:hypothetical protein